MKYLLLLAGDESTADATPESERQRILEEHGKFAAMIGADGAYVYAAQLVRSANATTLADGVLTDGPFAEGREQIGGFYVIEAPDLDKALGYARQIPQSPGLRVEVRPLLEM
jgi:hypothetical protein